MKSSLFAVEIGTQLDTGGSVATTTSYGRQSAKASTGKHNTALNRHRCRAIRLSIRIDGHFVLCKYVRWHRWGAARLLFITDETGCLHSSCGNLGLLSIRVADDFGHCSLWHLSIALIEKLTHLLNLISFDLLLGHGRAGLARGANIQTQPSLPWIEALQRGGRADQPRYHPR